MKSSNAPRRLVALIGSMAAVMCSAACSVGSLGTGDQAAGDTTITYLVFNEPSTVKAANALIAAFEKDNPQIKVKLDTMPTGSDGDNIVKTRLSTGEMSDVFSYNSGSLLQAIRPDEYLVSLSDQSWVKDLDKSYLPAVSTAKGLYGAPTGGSTPGGVVYNKAVYAKLGLKIPRTWDQFRANNLLIKKSGIAIPVEQTFGDAWTAQLVILADFANIAAVAPQWAADYTANKARNVDQPALSSWQHLRQLHDDGLLNKDFASATYDKGVQAIATGKAAHYPMLAGVIDAVRQNHPQYLKDIGMFAMPTATGTESHLTLFLPSGRYIPKTSTGAKLDAAKKFVAFTQTTQGCDLLVQSGSYGPFMNRLCKVPADAPAAIKELQTYVAAGNTGPALESVSPIKGPDLPQLAVEVGSGIRTADSGAKLYDQNVKQQAQQLGLPGW
ncbi:extracellular solute-binding protein [Kribbella sancticallisti]|uniref:Extracellular solute-binding protein n=1 Tax=Kribbella sancticallisti TaxID=460087 RepID=A0ABN2CJP0_9ACTN